jgi:hypothetical protein
MKAHRPEPSRLDQVLAQHRRRPTDTYWCLRLCQEVRPKEGDAVAALWANALARVASHDPAWFVSLSHLAMGELGVLSAPPEVLKRLEKRISIRDKSVSHYAKGVLWSHALRYKTPPPERQLRHAADHLLRVDERHRTDQFYEDLCFVLEPIDYGRTKGFFAPLLMLAPTGLVEPSAAGSALVMQSRVVFVLVAAARAGDWETYDAYRERFDEGDNAYRDCKIASCDGLRELAQGRDEHLVAILNFMTKRAANVEFLGGRDDTAFVEALVDRGRLPGECRAYLEATRAKAGVPLRFDYVGKLLARLAGADAPQG